MRSFKDSCTHFRRAEREKESFDSMMEKAKRHEDVVILDIDPGEQFFLSVMLEHEKEIIELRNRLMSGERMI